MFSRRGRLAALGLGVPSLLALLACPSNSLPTAPREASVLSSREASSDPPIDRMTIVKPSRSRRLPGVGGGTPTVTPAGPVPTATRPAPTSTPATPGTPAPSTATNPPASTPTRTPTPTQTRTQTPAGPTIIRLRAVRWAWQWVAGPGATPGNPQNSITLKSGRNYELRVFNGDIFDEAYQPHQFSGILEFGVSGAVLPYGGADHVAVFTAPVVTSQTTYSMSCMEFACGPVDRHEGMLGSIVVVP